MIAIIKPSILISILVLIKRKIKPMPILAIIPVQHITSANIFIFPPIPLNTPQHSYHKTLLKQQNFT